MDLDSRPLKPIPWYAPFCWIIGWNIGCLIGSAICKALWG